jgi:hypothetical protein
LGIFVAVLLLWGGTLALQMDNTAKKVSEFARKVLAEVFVAVIRIPILLCLPIRCGFLLRNID